METPPPTASPAPSHDTEQGHETEDISDSRRVANCYYHPHAPQPQQQPEPISLRVDSEEPPTSLRGDEDDDAPQYVGRVHQFSVRSTRSGFAGGSGGLLAFGAFEGLEPAFEPTPTTPDLRTSREALRAPAANDWTAAMDAEIDDMQHFNVFKEVPRPNCKNIVTP